ncbi:hypothetical protein [Bradyrhizobium retamae]|uniref:Uncharacterized protein n=1 Tax=Bradyrhizobium retamae TaxID=1300035 RepID=A0A0R3MKJ7_9BRAD|nr:hypothetical protein [Bradyrhizobium retamae]KRR20481.1 hypothetical protein CQ13_32320 [Bradyrhizobium retamae]
MNNIVTKIALGVLLVLPLPDAAKANEPFKLSNAQNISCSRDLKRGRLRIAKCNSYAYLFNTKTSEYFRCDVSLAVVRDAKEVITVQIDGDCVRKPRIFDTDSSYDLGFAETAPPSTNAFFGHGGFSVWAADTTRQKVRGCITIVTGLGDAVSRCVDMTFK